MRANRRDSGLKSFCSSVSCPGGSFYGLHNPLLDCLVFWLPGNTGPLLDEAADMPCSYEESSFLGVAPGVRTFLAEVTATLVFVKGDLRVQPGVGPVRRCRATERADMAWRMALPSQPCVANLCASVSWASIFLRLAKAASSLEQLVAHRKSRAA